MGKQAFCPQCHAPLPADAPGGLCPLCLINLARDASVGEAAADGLSSHSVTLPGAEPPFIRAIQDSGSADGIDVHEAPGRYSHLGEYSRGGMGRILLVHDRSIGRDVALKELLPRVADEREDTPVRYSVEVLARFLREAQLTGQLEHPGVVPVYELGRRPDDTLYYTMKLVRGKTLHDALVESKSYGERLKLLPHFVDLCQTMAYAHSRGVIHRDLKPKNVMVGEFGETVVIDWGLAKSRFGTGMAAQDSEIAERIRAMAGAAADYQTEDGTVMGTAAYMPPEQARGEIQNVNERSDVYALGAVLYEILTGCPPFTGNSTEQIIDKVLQGRPAPVLQVEPRVPPELAAICGRAMARHPEDRHASAKELAGDIEAFISGRVFREREARVAFLAVVYALGAALIAAGIITLVAYNWKRIPAHGQAALIVTTMLVLLGCGLHFWKVSATRPQLGHILVYLGVIVFGIDLLLLCRIYHIPLAGNWGLAGPNRDALAMRENVLFLLWGIGAFVVACAVRSNPITIIALVASFLWFCEELFSFSGSSLAPQVYCYPVVIAVLFLPAGYLWGSGRLFALLILAVSFSSVLLVAASPAANGPSVLGILLAMAAAIFPWGLLTSFGASPRKVALPALGLGILSLAIPAVALSMWHAFDLFYGMDKSLGLPPERFLPAILACIVASVLWPLAAWRDFGPPELRTLACGFALTLLIAISTLAAGCMAESRLGPVVGAEPAGAILAIFAAANGAVLILGGSVTWTGVLLLSRRIFWAGTFFIAGIAATRILEIDMNFQYKAFFFICAGIGLIAAGMRFESYLKKRRLV
ncbi:MAG: DUF2157 domain-containing protein [Candidatus Hydrogenedentes bacterium]|nr:DUF2157 domain-containing protein [Candidatus Hydrogenedentota bacterium]